MQTKIRDGVRVRTQKYTRVALFWHYTLLGIPGSLVKTTASALL